METKLYLIPLLKLDTLRITNSMFSIGCMLSLEDCIAVGEMLSPSRCPKNIFIANKDTYHIKSLEVPEGPCPSDNTLLPMVELIILHNMIEDHLGYCIAHSNCNWNLILPNTEGQNYYFNTLATEAVSISERGGHRGAKVVMLQGGKCEIIKSEYSDKKQKLYNYQPFHTSPDALNSLFTDMKHIMKLETLALRLPIEFSAWPDLSGLQHLHLEIGGCQSWKLDTILLRSVSSLKYFEIDSTTGDARILHDDCMAIANLLSSSNTLDWLCFSNNSNPLVVDSIMQSYYSSYGYKSVTTFIRSGIAVSL